MSNGDRTYFVKVNDAARLPLFETEAAGLAALAATTTVRVFAPLGHGVVAGRAYLVLEYLPLGGSSAGAMEIFGAATPGCTRDGAPVVFDPAVYYGDREADLAITELFGGFSDRFYAAYRETRPLAAGYPQRRTLYNLYHVLNHLNLFGGGYRAQAEWMIEQLLAELGG